MPSAVFSARTKAASTAVGASFRSVRLTVTAASSVRPPESVTVTVRLKTGLVSKFSWDEAATVISPVAESIAKAPLALPAVIA